MRLKVVLAPDPVLKTKAERIEKITPEIKKLAADMLDTMYYAHGIGLAANQVGVLKRILVMDVAQREGRKDPMVLINPEIIWTSEERCTKEEGCLSIPGHYATVERPSIVRLKYTDLDGKNYEEEWDSWAAVCVQHEIDHLNGILFPEHLSKLRRDMIMKKMAKDKKEIEKSGRDPFSDDYGHEEF